jgi:hypothetical protein
MKFSHSHRRPKATPTVNKKQPRPFVLALMLTGVLALKADSTLLKSALVHSKVLLSDSIKVIQNPISPSSVKNQRLWKIHENPTAIPPINPIYRVLPNPLFKPQGQLPKTIPVIFVKAPLNPELVINAGDVTKTLPPQVDTKVRETVAKETGVIAKDIKIVEARQQTWPDTCLGLATTEEICGQMLVPGWRVLVSDGRQTWVYRTDIQGRMIRLESSELILNINYD